MNLLDIGGGYPGSDDPETAIEGHAIFFKDIADVIRPLVDELFPPSVKVISEPGRYFVTESTVLCVNVIGRRKNIIGQIQDDSDDEGDSDDDGRDDDDKEADRSVFFSCLVLCSYQRGLMSYTPSQLSLLFVGWCLWFIQRYPL